ncbi:MAG: gliding motility-associated C-terminal domain-containing protein [Bacteroidetes bacterium]|nr:gliding motility-associated C-terminal domain-containing protein [Bacteroidota bacterium]
MNSKKLLLFILLAFFTKSIFSQGTLCSSATPFCTAVGTPFTYQNVTGTAVGQSGPNYGCLVTQPRPSWFYIKSSSAGVMTFSLTQSTSPGGTPNIDVDFIAYGPYSAAAFPNACSNLTGGCTSDHNCAGNTEDCSYSSSATETMTLNATAAGQYFIIMITNYNGTAGFITFTQTGGPATDCSITCPSVTSGDGFTLSSGQPLPSILSCDATTIPLYASDSSPFGAPVVPGVMFHLTTTSNSTYSINVTSSTGGSTVLGPLPANTNVDYQLYFMNPAATYSFDFCESNTAAANVPYAIVDLASGTTFTFGTWVDDGACQTVVVPAGTIKGVSTFTASCGACVTSNAWGTGSFNPSIAGVGTHTITYTFAPGAPCAPYVFSKVITVVSPTVTTAMTNTTICEGASATLTVSAGPTQTFSNTSSYTIPDGSATGVSSPITVSGIPGNAGSSLISINVNITHAYDSDLDLYLVSPCGYTIALSQANGGSGDNYTNTTFSTSGTSIYAGTAPFTGTFRPEDPLYALSGCASNGTWRLFVKDDYTPDQGTITSWSMSFTDKNTYSWSPSSSLSASTGTNVIATPSVTTVYSVTASTNAGCVSAVKTITVTVNPKPTLTITPASTVVCAGTAVTLTGSGASTYTWTGGITNGSAFTPASSTSYTLSASSASGCTNTAVASVSVNPIPTANAGSPSTLTCSSPSVTLSGSGGGTYAWTGPSITSGSNTASPVVNGPGTYSLVVTSTAGCTSTVSTVAISQNTATPITTAGTTGSITCTTNTINLTSTLAGMNYTWTAPAGSSITSGVNSQNATGQGAGTYTVKVVNATTGCSVQATVAANVNTTTPVSTAGTTGSITCATNTISLTSTLAGMNYTWTAPAGSSISSGVNSQNAVGQGVGTYTVKVVNATTGCSVQATVAANINTTTPVSTAGTTGTITCTTNTINLTSTLAGMNYTWTAPAGSSITSGVNAQNAVGQGVGTYTVKVMDPVNSCSVQSTIAANVNTVAPITSAGTTGSITCTTNTINLTSTLAGMNYTWTAPAGSSIASGVNSQNAVGQGAGTYTVKVVNATTGCSVQATVAANVNTVVPVTTAGTTGTITCTTNTISLTSTLAGMSYTWTAPAGSSIISGVNSQNATGQGVGTYTVKAMDAVSGCSVQSTIAANVNTTTPVSTAGTTGTITCTTNTINLTSTLAGMNYTWTAPAGSSITSGVNAQNATGQGVGTYTVKVVNAVNGCSVQSTIAANVNTVTPVTTANTSGSITCVTNTISLTSTLAGMNYTWTAPAGSSIASGTNLQNATGQGIGTYTLSVLNSVNGCTYSTSIAAVQNTTTPTSVNAGPTQTLICGVPTVTLTGSATPASATANWLGGVSSPNSFTTTTGSANTYTLQAIDPTTGCSISSTVQVLSSVGSPTVTANAVTNSITCTNSSVGIGVTLSSAGPVTYQWSGPGISGANNNATATATVAGVYNVTVTNNPGNNCSVQINITVPSNTTAVVASISPASTITCNTPSVTLSASPVGSTYTYTWSGNSPVVSGGSTQNPIVNVGDTYSVAITNTVNGCVGNAAITVASNTTAPIVNIAVPSVTTTCANPTVTIAASSTPSTGVTYSWTAPASGSLNNNTISNPIASGSGIFTVVVTNTATGCSSSITQNTLEVVADSGIPTVTLSSNSASITCSDPAPSVSITTTASPVSYSWSPSSGIVPGTETTSTPSFTAAGSYSAVVTNTNSGCATSSSGNVVTVTLDNTVPVSTLSSGVNNGTLTCLTTSISVTPTVVPANSNYTYSWSPSAGISSPVNQANATFTAAGVYTLAITNTLTGCVSTSTASANSFTVVADNTPPTFTLGTAPSVTTTCAFPSATLSASSNADPNSVYTWITPTSNTLTGNPLINSTPGIYTVTVTNTVNGCSSAATGQNTVEVIADAGIPSVNLSATSVSITCSNPTPSVSITTTASPVSYSWSPSSGIVPGTETTSTPSFTAAGSYSVVVTNTTSGCSTNSNANVVTVTSNNTIPVILPFVGATNSGTVNCITSSVTASPMINPSSPDYTYVWSPTGTGLTTPANQANATFTAAGVYSLAVTNSVTGCTSVMDAASTFTVFSDQTPPTATIVPVSTNTIIGCGASNATVTLDGSQSTSTNPSPVFTWLPSNTSGATLPVTTSGTYTLVVTDAVSGCSNTAQYFVDGNTTPPQNVSAGAIANIACGSNTVALNGTTTSTNVSYSWSGPLATSIVSGGSTLNPIVTSIGPYTLTVTDNLTGCQSTATVNVSQANVTAAFTADPTTGISPLTVNFTDASTGATSWNWNFGDSNTSATQNPTNVYTSGSYTVTLTASSGSCTSTATLVVVVEDGLTLEIPNVFTPNNDGKNDVFTIKSTGVKEISLQIFNRWGEKLYEFSGAKASWDGEVPNGSKAPDATYFYFVKATGFDGKEIEQHGTVSLFR